MKSFQEHHIENQQITQNLIALIGQIREYKGKQELYRVQAPHVLKSLVEVATIQSTESSNRIEGVVAPHQRIVDLVQEKTTPKNRPEEEILGYRYVLGEIHQNHRHIPFTPNIIAQLHGDLYRFSGKGGGQWKTTENVIEEVRPDGSRKVRFQPVPAFQTPDTMERLHTLYNAQIKEGQVEPLLLIAAYVLDFLCIHPFLDGNGRMSRLITLMLLYHTGYEVGRYISLEKIIEESKEGYYNSLHQSSQGWHEGQHNLIPWFEYFLTTLLAGQKQLETILTGSKGAKTRFVLEAVDQFKGEFSIQAVAEACPTVSIDLIRRVLRKEKEAGRLKSIGRGPFAKWQRES